MKQTTAALFCVIVFVVSMLCDVAQCPTANAQTLRENVITNGSVYSQTDGANYNNRSSDNIYGNSKFSHSSFAWTTGSSGNADDYALSVKMKTTAATTKYDDDQLYLFYQNEPTKVLSSGGGITVFEFDVKPDTTCDKLGWLALPLWVNDASLPGGYVLFDSDGKIRGTNYSYSAKKWIHMKLAYNTGNGMWNVYVTEDGTVTKIVDNLPAVSGAWNLRDRIIWYLLQSDGKQQGAETAGFALDNCKIYREYELNDNISITTAQIDVSNADSPVASVEVDNTSDVSVPANAIMAYYNEEGKICNVTIDNKILACGENRWSYSDGKFLYAQGMTMRLFLWTNEFNPITQNKKLEFVGGINDDSMAIEAETMIVGSNARAYSDADASGAGGAWLVNNQWEAEQTVSDDLNAHIYLNDEAAAGRYKLWMRCYNTSGDSGSVWYDLNCGKITAKWFNSAMDNVYRWIGTDIYLNAGDNYFSVRSRTTAKIDKFIITKNTNFVPSGKDDFPVYQTQQEQETQWLSYWDAPAQKPIAGHPRLYVTPETRETLRSNITAPETNWMYQKFRGYAYETLNCRLDTTLSDNHNGVLLVKLMSRALVWMLGDETDINHAKQTISYLRDYLDTVRTPDDEADITRVRGDTLTSAAIIYDWCYDALSDNDKAYFKTKFIDISASKEIGWPPVNLSSVSSHGGEQEIFRDILAAGVAIYDEYPVMYEVAAGRMFEEMVPARLWLRSSGRHDQGNDYGECRAYSELWADMTMQRMGYPSIYGNLNAGFLKWMLWSRLPYGSMMPSGDMYSLTRTTSKYYYSNYILAYCIAGNLYNVPELKLEFKRREQLAYQGEDIQFYSMLFNNTSVPTQLWDSEPLTAEAQYPMSAINARTGWQEGYNSDCAMAFMNMHEVFTSDHQNIYTGDFQLYYKGLLAMNTGTYNASTLHNEGYKRRAVAGNTMLCYDPDEHFYPTWDTITVPNDGGQRTPYVNENGVTKGSAVKLLTEFNIDENGKATNEDLIVAKNVKKYIGINSDTPAFSYISGDLTNAYSDKVSDYHRSMVFMDLYNDDYPAAFVVYDNMTSSDASFKKTWLLHSQQQPQISGDKITITRTDEEFSGKLVDYIMLPQNADVTAVGGENDEMFTVGGILMAPKKDTVEGGKYRIEVSPSAQSQQDTFLNAMYMTDAENDAELMMTKTETDKLIGVCVLDRLVMFAKNGDISQSFSFTVANKNDAENQILLCGIENGMWNINGNGINLNVLSENGKNCLCFNAPNGTYTVSKTTGTASTITAPKIAKRNIGDFSVWKQAYKDAPGYNGNFLYLPNPTIYQNAKPYIPITLLSDFGANVLQSGTSADITLGTNVVHITAGSYDCTINSVTNKLSAMPFISQQKMYVNPQDFSSFLGYDFTYNQSAKTLRATKK